MSRYRSSDLQRHITRRDFIGATLVGAGASLLSQVCPAQQSTGIGREWTGYAGVGDYRFSNGNTAEVVQSAHRIRDRVSGADAAEAADTGEAFDVIVVGGGFAGLAALLEFKKRRPNGTCLLLDNHPIFGGYAKSNEFLVDGYRVLGPQASINFASPALKAGEVDPLWEKLGELGVPTQFRFVEKEAGRADFRIPRATSAAMYWAEHTATVGCYFQNTLTPERGLWVTDIWDDDLKRAPWPESLKGELLRFRDARPSGRDGIEAEAKRLDKITYADLITRELKLSPEVLDYISPIMAIVGQSPEVSAYAARRYQFPGVKDVADRSPYNSASERYMSFPGGNATVLRHFVKAVFPGAIRGPGTFEAIANNAVNLAALDLPGASYRMRLGATVTSVSHDGSPGAADSASVVYEKGGELYRVKARGVVLAAGSWVAKRIVRDLPEHFAAAMGQFLYAPILIVNVALRNWRFLEKLGFASARWFDGFGFYCTIRQPMVLGRRSPPFHPDKPMVMTFYVPIPVARGLPLIAQGPAARAQLYATAYADYERQIVSQMELMFAAGGFDARRDIAGIVLNRWGHASLSAPPGFFFGNDATPSPLQVLAQPFGRIAFGNAELSGAQSMPAALMHGQRALNQVLGVL